MNDPRTFPASAATAFLRGASFVMAATARGVARLPDRVIVGGVAAARIAARAAGAPADALRAVADLEGLVRDDPRGLDALRRIVLETRDGQLRATLAGLLRHWVAPAPAPHGMRTERIPRRAGAVATVGIGGDGPDAALLADAYGRQAGCHAARLDPGPPPPGLDLLEITAPGALAAAAEGLLDAGTAVSLHLRCIESVAHLDRLRDAARRSGAPLRVVYPPAFWPPVRRLAGILADGGLGEVASIRVQAVLGDAGKPPSAALPASGWPRHDAFDHGLLLALLGGPITRATAYLGTMTARGGAGLAACAFRDPGRYGVLELVHAPGLRIESDHAPHDLQVEVAGTDGVAWLRRGAGRRTMQPALEVRAGRDWVSMGSGTGLDDDWAAAWEIAARDGLDWIRGRAVPVPGLDLVRGALALRDRMAEASERAEVIEL